MRLQPFLVTMGLGTALAAVPVAALGAETVRLAQRWTPLTGMLAPESETPKADEAAEPPKTPESAKPAPPSARAADRAEGRQTIRVTLVRTVTEGQPHGGLGVKTTAVDEDLARGLGLGAARGALVTDVTSSAANLLVGDVIETLDGGDVAGPQELGETLRRFNPDQEVVVSVWRAGAAGALDFRRLLADRADAGNVDAAASLGRLLSLGQVLGPKDYGAAARYYLSAAEGGHLGAMTRYALFAKDGIGVARNEAVAATWFRKAADGGQDAAMTNLGGLYEAGRGVKQDFAEAARWYRRAVDEGNMFAMHRLGLLTEAGRGVAKNDQEAVRLLRSASDKGLSEATSWLADKFEQGRGIAKDEAEAYRLHARAADQVRRAADLGNAVATFNLGILYRIGKGVKKSDTEAAYWVVRSLKLGDKYLVAELIRNPNVLSLGDRKWLQEVLRDEGTYKGPIDGTFSPAVRTAMESLAARA